MGAEDSAGEQGGVQDQTGCGGGAGVGPDCRATAQLSFSPLPVSAGKQSPAATGRKCSSGRRLLAREASELVPEEFHPDYLALIIIS